MATPDTEESTTPPEDSGVEIPEGQGGGAEGQTEVEPATEAAPKIELTPQPEPEAKPEPAPKQDWRDKRIAQLTARLREVQSKAPVATPEPSGTPAPAGALDPASFSAAVEVAAEAKAEAKTALAVFNEACNLTAAKGKAAYKDFDSSVKNLQTLIDGGDPKEAAAYNSFVYAAIETGEGAKVLYELGQDPDEAMRIMSLSPVKMGIEMAKRALGAGPAREISNAPRPITSVSRNGRSANVEITPGDKERADQLSTKTWMERREAEVARQRR